MPVTTCYACSPGSTLALFIVPRSTAFQPLAVHGVVNFWVSELGEPYTSAATNLERRLEGRESSEDEQSWRKQSQPLTVDVLFCAFASATEVEGHRQRKSRHTRFTFRFT